MTNVEKQQAYKERMYAAGYKQRTVWIPRDPEKREHITRTIFLKRFDELTKGWSGKKLSAAFNTILGMVGREARRRT
jgi:hypothetical protein